MSPANPAEPEPPPPPPPIAITRAAVAPVGFVHVPELVKTWMLFPIAVPFAYPVTVPVGVLIHPCKVAPVELDTPELLPIMTCAALAELAIDHPLTKEQRSKMITPGKPAGTVIVPPTSQSVITSCVKAGHEVPTVKPLRSWQRSIR